MTRNFFRNADGVVLVYDITDRDSFNKIRDWIESCRDSSRGTNIKMVIVGNKIDLKEDRVVLTDEGIKFASGYGIPFYETSAKENINIEEAFSKLISEIANDLETQKTETISIRNPQTNVFSCCI